MTGSLAESRDDLDTWLIIEVKDCVVLGTFSLSGQPSYWNNFTFIVVSRLCKSETKNKHKTFFFQGAYYRKITANTGLRKKYINKIKQRKQWEIDLCMYFSWMLL